MANQKWPSVVSLLPKFKKKYSQKWRSHFAVSFSNLKYLETNYSKQILKFVMCLDK
jgi:hypothetical protein